MSNIVNTFRQVTSTAPYEESTNSQQVKNIVDVQMNGVSPSSLSYGVSSLTSSDNEVLNQAMKIIGYFVSLTERPIYTIPVYGDEITVRGSYDLAFRLPPVPYDGTYEIRIWNNSLAGSSNNDRGVVQFYTHHYNPTVDADLYWRDWDWEPQGIPIDLRIGGNDGRIGMVPDNDDRYEGMTNAQKEEAIYLNDRAMRVRGYLKAPDSYTKSGSTSYSGDPIRTDNACYRKIMCTEYLKADNDYWVRMRQVYEDDGVFPFSFIEIVPKDVYEGNEDMH